MTRTPIDPRQFLKRLPLFADLSPQQLDTVAAASTELQLVRGQILFERGDSCAGFYTVIYGKVKLGFISAEGDEKVVELISPGQHFGEAPMFMERPYVMQAQTLSDCRRLHVGKHALFAAVERNSAFSRRLHDLIADVESLSLRTGGERILGYLVKDDPPEGAEAALAVSKKTIASRLNLSPEYSPVCCATWRDTAWCAWSSPASRSSTSNGCAPTKADAPRHPSKGSRHVPSQHR